MTILEVPIAIICCLWLRILSGAEPQLKGMVTTEEILTLMLLPTCVIWWAAKRKMRQEERRSFAESESA